MLKFNSDLVSAYLGEIEVGKIQKDLLLLLNDVELDSLVIFYTSSGISLEKSIKSFVLYEFEKGTNSEITKKVINTIIDESLDNIYELFALELTDDISFNKFIKNMFLVNDDNVDEIINKLISNFLCDNSQEALSDLKILYPDYSMKIFNILTSNGTCLRHRRSQIVRYLGFEELKENFLNIISNDDEDNRDVLDTFYDDKEFLKKLRDRVLDFTPDTSRAIKLIQINNLYNL